jgi:hypothetical protein
MSRIVAIGAGVLVIAALQAPIVDAQAQTSATQSIAAADIQAALPAARLIGQARLKKWGFEVYDASLWAPAGFSGTAFASQSFALELIYLRNLKASDIVVSSIQEMRRAQAFDDQLADKWAADLLRVIPDIRKGDRIMGINQPGTGAVFLVNGRTSGTIADTRFAQLFFSIWLASTTSEARMRTALLAGAGG